MESTPVALSFPLFPAFTTDIFVIVERAERDRTFEGYRSADSVARNIVEVALVEGLDSMDLNIFIFMH